VVLGADALQLADSSTARRASSSGCRSNRYSSNPAASKKPKTALGRAGLKQLQLHGDDVGDETEPFGAV